MTKVLLIHHDEPGLCGEPHPVVWSDSLLFGARPWLVFAAAVKGESLLLVTIGPLCNEFWAMIRLNSRFARNCGESMFPTFTGSEVVTVDVR